MAVPKRKTSRARRNSRRANNWKLVTPAFSKCDHCGDLKSPHHVCKKCGFYKGKDILKMEVQ